VEKPIFLIAILLAVAIVSFLLSPKVKTVEGFFRGFDEDGRAPGLWTVVLSQVTTWIFARSLLNAAILGYFYGIAGVLAYATYYLSFITGGIFVDRIRFQHGCGSVQQFLSGQFGRFGTVTYNVVIAVRLLSEVFANLLVIGIIFGVAGTTAYTLSILLVAVLTLGYSMIGGLRASLRTDVFQASLLIAALVVLFVLTTLQDNFTPGAIFATNEAMTSGPGWILAIVALLQITSYPLHDPVMMDRGFLADRETTWMSFVHAGWISTLAILAFGVIGVYGGVHKIAGEELVSTLLRLLGEPAMLIFNFALVVSAVSTLDSTFASAAKLTVIDMGLATPTPSNGRWAMTAFLIGGLVFLFWGSKDLFAAVAVSGTASMFLAPVALFCILGGKRVAPWAYMTAFAVAMAGAALYMLEVASYVSLFDPLFGVGLHKYTKLLIICLGVLTIGCSAFAIGIRQPLSERTA
jgi:Na+/proline symporter